MSGRHSCRGDRSMKASRNTQRRGATDRVLFFFSSKEFQNIDSQCTQCRWIPLRKYSAKRDPTELFICTIETDQRQFLERLTRYPRFGEGMESGSIASAALRTEYTFHTFNCFRKRLENGSPVDTVTVLKIKEYAFFWERPSSRHFHTLSNDEDCDCTGGLSPLVHMGACPLADWAAPMRDTDLGMVTICVVKTPVDEKKNNKISGHFT